MRIVINAQLDPSRSGGIAQVVSGLASSLGQLPGPEEYVFVCTPVSAEWLQAFVGPNSTIMINKVLKPGPSRGVRPSDGLWESFKPDVLHFPYQSFTRTAIASVFNPHDLQHVHLPEMFTSDEIERRESLYHEACESAAAVVVVGQWVKDDLIRHYGLHPEKVRVIGWGSPLSLSSAVTKLDADDLLRRFDISKGFALYPAQSWPHKNHLRLLEAMAILRDRGGIATQLVCTGAQTDFFNEIARRQQELRLGTRVRFLGRVDEAELRALYAAASFVIVPTLFDPASFPILDAFFMGVPVACSNVGGLPEQVGDAALQFNPRDVEDICGGMERIHLDLKLRMELVQRGYQRLANFSWSRIAHQYRELYRRLAKSPGYSVNSAAKAQATKSRG